MSKIIPLIVQEAYRFHLHFSTTEPLVIRQRGMRTDTNAVLLRHLHGLVHDHKVTKYGRHIFRLE